MKHNIYFEGKVQSLGLATPEGPATVGVIEPGKYTFSTEKEERMSIVAGAMKVKLPGSTDWHTAEAGDTFTIPAGKSFDVDAAVDTAYICYYK